MAEEGNDREELCSKCKNNRAKSTPADDSPTTHAESYEQHERFYEELNIRSSDFFKINEWALNRNNASHRAELCHLELSHSVLGDLEIIRTLRVKYNRDKKTMASKLEQKISTDIYTVEYFKDAEGVCRFNLSSAASNCTRKTKEELQGSSMWTELEDEYLKTDLEFGKCLYEQTGGERVFAYPLPDEVSRCLRMYMERERKEIPRLAPKIPFNGYIKGDTRKLHPNIADNLVTSGVIEWTGCKWLHGRKPTRADVQELKAGGQKYKKPGVLWLQDVCGFKEHVPQS